MIALLGSTALVYRRKGQASGKTSCGRAAIYPCQFKRNQGQCKILRTRDESALLRLHEHCRDSRSIEMFQQFVLLLRPFV